MAGESAARVRGSDVTLPKGTKRVPVVALGASAGGLDALEKFLGNVPPRSGIAFVVVQHLDPTHKGMLAEILQRACAMPVHQIKARMRVAAEHVYVIPPNQELTLVRGVLRLFPRPRSPALRLPIDRFFRSLAKDAGPLAIGVVLSGMGADGTLGLRAIKEAGGAAFVQALATAQFDGMPGSAIAAGLADVVGSPAELPAKIIQWRRRSGQKPPAATPPAPARALDDVIAALRDSTGQDFSLYKHGTLRRRIERRMVLHQVTEMRVYARYLRENRKEALLLFQELLIGVTSFFRDPVAWRQLEKEVLPALIADAPHPVLRAWVPACSTGEEAYSLAIAWVMAQAATKSKKKLTLQIFATDIDADTIARARLGVFGPTIETEVPRARLARFFVKEAKGYRVTKQIRDMVVFATQNVISDPPFTKLDLLACRNLLIYLMPALQQKLLALFHYALRPGGMLFLGNAETVSSDPPLLEPLRGGGRFFRRATGVRAHAANVDFPVATPREPTEVSAASRDSGAFSARRQASVDRFLLQRFAPAAVVVSQGGDILYVSGRASSYLELPAGKANWNIFAMAGDALRGALANGLRRAQKTGASVLINGVPTGSAPGGRVVDVAIEPLTDLPAMRRLMTVVFTDAAASPSGKHRATKVGKPDAERALERAREELRAAYDELREVREDRVSTTEELQSSNEELQSSNEELTTSKEELQSMNEELQSLNAELQATVGELSRTSNDMKNLLDSTEIATLFLDDRLNVRRFTPEAAKLVKLIPGDLGRPVTDLAFDIEYPTLQADAREVLRTLAPKRDRDRHAGPPLVLGSHDAVPHSRQRGLWAGAHVLRRHRCEEAGSKATEEGLVTRRKTPPTPAQRRAQAEAEVKRAAVPTSVTTPEDAVRLMHELQVHQVELEQQNEELCRSREEVELLLAQYSDLYDFAPAAYFTLARDGTVQRANLTAAGMLGVARSLIVEKQLIAFIADADRVTFQRVLDCVFEGGAKASCVVALGGAAKPGGETFVQVTGQHADGGECRIVVVDVSEQKRAEEKLRVAQKMEVVGRLAGGVAHDFNNILTVIMSHTEFALAGLDGSDPRRQDLLEVQAASAAAAALTRQLLTFSRNQVVEPQRLNLDLVTKGLLRMVRRTLGEDILVVHVAAPALPQIEVDRGLLEQVLMNLVVNARDAMPRGGKLAIETALAEGGKAVLLTMTDTGVGMAPCRRRSSSHSSRRRPRWVEPVSGSPPCTASCSSVAAASPWIANLVAAPGSRSHSQPRPSRAQRNGLRSPCRRKRRSVMARSFWSWRTRAPCDWSPNESSRVLAIR